MKTILNASGIRKRYKNTAILHDVSLDLRQGEALGLLGANGAGKSTLIKCLLGLVRPDAGAIEYHDRPPAYLPEHPQLPLSLSASALLRFKCEALGLHASLAETMLLQLGLPVEKHRKPIREYSKGMRQRVALAFALCGDPAGILLDEPMSGLDALGRAEVLALLQDQKQQGMALLMSSHIVTDMVRLCDRILIIAHGSIVEEVALSDHSLQEAQSLERKLAYWTRPTHDQ